MVIMADFFMLIYEYVIWMMNACNLVALLFTCLLETQFINRASVFPQTKCSSFYESKYH